MSVDEAAAEPAVDDTTDQEPEATIRWWSEISYVV